MSTPANVVAASIGTPTAATIGGPSTNAPTPSASGAPAPASSGGFGSGFLSWLNPFSGAVNFLPNAALVLAGIVLAIGALLISQKDTVVQVASAATKV
jgi:hypothetical protein